MSSDLQASKTKMDAQALGSDASAHTKNAGEKIKEGLHKAGVALGVSERTPGEKVGHGIQKTVDTVTGDRQRHVSMK